VPPDWLAVPISLLRPFVTSGSRDWARYYADSGDAFLRIGNLQRTSIDLDLTDVKYIRLPATDREGLRTQLEDGDVLVSITADIGIVGFVTPQVPKPAYINQHIALLRFDPNEVNPAFIAYALASQRSQRAFRELVDAGAKAGLNLETVQSVVVCCPRRKAEQDRIADCLREVDDLVKHLEQLLAKRRKVKQGAMQDLLSGRQRLPGFTQPWQLVSFGSLAIPSRDRVARGFAKCIELEDVVARTGRLRSSVIGERAFSGQRTVFRKGDVLFGRLRAYLQKYWLASIDGVCSTEIWVLRVNRAKAVPEFVHQVVQTDRFIEAATVSYGTHMPRSDWRVVGKLEMLVPEALNEQATIGSILSDMSAEIAALEAKLTKLRLLKQAMMEELLSGLIHLVSPHRSAEAAPLAVDDSRSPVIDLVHYT